MEVRFSASFSCASGLGKLTRWVGGCTGLLVGLLVGADVGSSVGGWVVGSTVLELISYCEHQMRRAFSSFHNLSVIASKVVFGWADTWVDAFACIQSTYWGRSDL